MIDLPSINRDVKVDDVITKPEAVEEHKEVAKPKKVVDSIKRITIDIVSDNDIRIKFNGNHVRNRTLLKAFKAVRIEYRKSVKLYRRQQRFDRVDRQNVMKAEKLLVGVDSNGK